MLIQSSNISGNTCSNGGYGGGIYNWAFGVSLTIINSSIHDNNVGGGIYSKLKPVTIINSTISNNVGSGIYNYMGTLIITDSTIANNDGGGTSGGIYFVNQNNTGSVTLYNSVLGNNKANSAPDCYGPITSAGYNILSDSVGCTFAATTGDQIDVDALLGPLQDNGGPTFTHWLYQGSPAIDGGNPAGCTDHLGNSLTTDQRGFSRPLDGNSDGINVCDIGAYEADPANLPPVPPTNNWYVKPGGNNNNSCLSPAAACATINGAINKSQSGDTIFVAIRNLHGLQRNRSGTD